MRITNDQCMKLIRCTQLVIGYFDIGHSHYAISPRPGLDALEAYSVDATAGGFEHGDLDQVVPQ